MSHYTVLVIGGNVDAKLEQYDENLQVEPYVEYTKEELLAKKAELVEESKENPEYAEYAKYAKMSVKDFAMKFYCLEVDNDENAVSTYNPVSIRKI